MSFRKEDRYYDIPGLGKVPSVTTILGAVNKPALVAWAANQGTKKLYTALDMLKEMDGGLHDKLVEKLPHEFFKAGRQIMEEAAADGTAAHGIIEKVITKQPYDLESITPRAKNAVELFFDWQKKTNFEPIKAESTVFSKTHRYAGTLDFLARIDGEPCLIDFKTSKKIYSEMELQVIAYLRAAEEMSGEKIPRAMILRIGKTDSAFEVKEINAGSHDNLFRTFLHVFELWKFLSERQND